MSFLNPIEEDRLHVFLAAELARRNLSLGLKLNAPEAVALIADGMHFAGRGGAGYDEVVAVGMSVLTEEKGIDGIPDIVAQVRVEVLLEEGSRLILLQHPIRPAIETPSIRNSTQGT